MSTQQEPIPAGGITSAYRQKRSRVADNQRSLGFFNQLFLVLKPNNKWRPARGCLLSYTNTGTVEEISEISCTGSDIPVQSTAIRFVHSTHGVYCNSQGGETDVHTQGYKIGLLTATEKQVHLGRLGMRPIQWHLKNNWRVPESLEKVIPIPRSLHPHLQWWLEEDNVLTGQPLHPVKHALQVFTDVSQEG